MTDPRYDTPPAPPPGWASVPPPPAARQPHHPSPPHSPGPPHSPAPQPHPAPPHGAHQHLGPPPPAVPGAQVSPPGPWAQPPPDLLASPAPRRGPPRWVVALAAATAVLSVVSFVTVLLWPAGESGEGPPATGPLAFHAFEQVARVDFDQASRTAFTQLTQDQLYVGWEQGGDLEVVAAEVTTGAERWRQSVTGSPRWGQLFPAPGAVVVVGADEDGDASQMYVLDSGGGAQLWSKEVTSEDWASAAGENLVWYHEPDGVVRGMHIPTGREEWSQPVSADATTTWTLTAEDLARPTDTLGYLGVVSTDPRLAVVEPDRSAFVLDTRNGTVVSQASNLARPSDNLLAYGDRLFVAADEAGFHLVSYALDDLGGLPQTHYRAGPDQYPEEMRVCGVDRVCLLETEGYDRETTEAVMVNTAESGGELWRQPVSDAQTLFSVGEWLLVMVGTDGPVFGYNAAGLEVLNRPGVAARLNSENLLVFAESLWSTERNVSVAGIAVGGERPVELGQLPDVIGDQCSWNLTYVSCPDQDGATIWRFAEDPER